jgi:hypothetical protein
MPRPSVVAVYGVLPGEHRPRRLGSGRLRTERLVLLDPPLSDALGSTDPPEVVRVGIASLVDGEPFVEVIEVRQVGSSTHAVPRWAAELASEARSPTTLELAFGEDEDPIRNGVCAAFPFLSFCS